MHTGESITVERRFSAASQLRLEVEALRSLLRSERKADVLSALRDASLKAGSTGDWFTSVDRKNGGDVPARCVTTSG